MLASAEGAALDADNDAGETVNACSGVFADAANADGIVAVFRIQLLALDAHIADGETVQQVAGCERGEHRRRNLFRLEADHAPGRRPVALARLSPFGVKKIGCR